MDSSPTGADSWVVTASATIDTSNGYYDIDDSLNPWLQVDMVDKYTVRGVELFVRDEKRYRIGNVQFRVGNIDVSSLTDGADVIR